MGYDINEASQQLRDTLKEEPSMDLDHLFTTIKDMKSEREKKLKQDFEFQKESLNLKAQARNAGFDIEYDPSTNTIRPVNLPVEEPPRISATRGVKLEEPQLQNYMAERGLTREQALAKLEGGITTVETGSRTPQKPGEKPLKPEIDPGSEAVMAGYKQSQISQAKAKYAPEKAKKPLTESQRTAISYQHKVSRMINEIFKVLPTANRALAVQDKGVTTAGKLASKALGMFGNKKGAQKMWQANDQAEQLRDYIQQLEATIPFAKGGKALTEVEKQILFRLLEYGPRTSMETIRRNLKEFKVEYTLLGKLAEGEPLTEEELLSQAASEDISSMAGDVDSTASELQKFMEENGLEQ